MNENHITNSGTLKTIACPRLKIMALYLSLRAEIINQCGILCGLVSISNKFSIYCLFVVFTFYLIFYPKFNSQPNLQ